MMSYKFERKGFTLIELLVVIAVIALLMAVIMPALNKAKQIAAAAVCLANENQLIMGYLLYAEDNDSYLADGDTAAAGSNGYSNYGDGPVHNWVGEPEMPDLTVDDKIRGFEFGSLWPYLEAPKVYNCPADKRWRKINDDANPGQINGYRTYSIGNPLSKRPSSQPGENESTISKLSEFVNPSNKVVFLEETETEYAWNNRTWNMSLSISSPAWVDPFAILHNGSSTFAYADGHADRHKWVEEVTIEMAKEGKKNETAILPDGTTSEDWLWFKRAYIPGRRPPGF